MKGQVFLIGAGPGASDLITVRGVEALRRADVVVHDRLVNRELLQYVRPGAEIIYVGKTPGGPTTRQERINEIIVAKALTGANVARLKGGDPYVFGRGWEELEACYLAGVECSVVPGISSSMAAPSAAGIPVTHRAMSRSFTVVTARTANDDDLNYTVLSQLDTVVFLMGRARLPHIAQSLIAAGKSASTPSALVECGTTPEQRVLRGPLGELAALADQGRFKSPCTIVVGEVAGLAPTLEASRFTLPEAVAQ